MLESPAGRRLGWSGAILLIAVFALIPVVWIISLSFKDPSTIGDGSFLPTKWTWSNYNSIFGQSIFTDALRNSIGIALISTVIAVFIACFAAYAIARLDFPGKNFVLAASLGIAMFPPISLVGPLYNLWRNIGLYDTWPGLIIPYMTFALPLSIFTLSAFFREIPWELEQAAQVDGATPFQAFFKVIAPLAAPGIFTTGILVFLFCWNDFVFASTLTSTNAAQTVPAALAAFPGASQFTQPIGTIAAAAVIVTIPVVIIVLLFQRRIVSGLTAGAVKG
jgi:multiple sugar transport system permease protein